MENEREHQEEEQDISELLQVRRDKLAALREEGRDPYALTTYDRDAYAREIKDAFESWEGKQVSLAGRMMSRRDMGKAFFSDLMDVSGRIQLCVRQDELGEEEYARFKKLDISDIIGVNGEVFRTKKGEISVRCVKTVLLCKSLRPLPEKFHGLRDPDLRYRKRYLDLIMNEDVRSTFVARSKIISVIRREMDARGYLEVETPVLQNRPSNANARPFHTHHNTLSLDMVMRVELELALKRLVVGGLERVYELGRLFRNEGMDVKHNPEFTMIEMYEAYTDYNGMMKLCEDLFAAVARELTGGTKIVYQGVELDFTPPWQRVTMTEAVRRETGLDFAAYKTDDEARSAAKAAGFDFGEKIVKGELLNEVFESAVEHTLIQPTFLCDYPVEISPLTKRTPYDPMLVERFEGFVYGREAGNAYSELNDPVDQRERFVEQAQKKNIEGEFELDEDFIMAIEHGLPPTGGMGIGVDRMVMLFTDSPSIRDVILFPTMKPENS